MMTEEDGENDGETYRVFIIALVAFFIIFTSPLVSFYLRLCCYSND